MTWKFWKKSETPQKPAPEALPKDRVSETPKQEKASPVSAPPVESKTAAAAEKPEKTDEEMAAELQEIAPELMAQAKTPQMRQRLINIARKMKAAGVDLKSDRQVSAWIKKHPEEAEEPKQKVETYIRKDPRVGRNDPCTCGSGKKYKKCCGRK